MNYIQHHMHQFANSSRTHIQGLQRGACDLVVRQQPEHACVNVAKEKDRKTIDPPPVVELKVRKSSDPDQNFLSSTQSPYYFMSCNLVGDISPGQAVSTIGQALTGNNVSSAHRLKDVDNHEGAFFVFADLSVKVEGSFRLEFNLFEMIEEVCNHITSVLSEPFAVHPKKHFAGMMESTQLTRTFSDQGVRLRLRKEPRALLKKRGPASDDYQPRRYKSSGRKKTNKSESSESQKTTHNTEVDDSTNSPELSATSLSGKQTMGLHRDFSQLSYAAYSPEEEHQPRMKSEQSLQHVSYQRSVENSPHSATQAPSFFPQFSPQSFDYPFTQSSQIPNPSRHTTLQPIDTSSGRHHVSNTPSAFGSQMQYSSAEYLSVQQLSDTHQDAQYQDQTPFQAFGMSPRRAMVSQPHGASVMISPHRFNIAGGSAYGSLYHPDALKPRDQNSNFGAGSLGTSQEDKNATVTSAAVAFQNTLF